MAGIDEYTKLMLHADGDGQTFVDSSRFSHTVNANGNVTQSTTQKKFGSKSAYFDGSGDYLTSPDSEDWDYGSGDFTIDWWEYRTNSNDNLVSITRDGGGGYNAFAIGYAYSNNLGIFMSSNGTSWDIASNKSLGSISLNTWVHLAVVRYGNTFYAFKNGILTDTWESSAELLASDQPLTIGRFATNYFNGYIDELRVSKGIARWTANFTPPTGPYEDDGITGDIPISIGVSSTVDIYGLIELNQVIAQVEYQIPSLIKTTQVASQVEYTFSGYALEGDIPIALGVSSEVEEYTIEVTGNIPITIGVSSDVEIDLAFIGDIQITLGISSEVEILIEIVGDIPITLAVSSEVEVLIELIGNIPITIGVSSEFEIEMEIVGNIPIVFGITSDFEPYIPPEYLYELTGGVTAGGQLEIDVIFEPLTLEGGLEAGGELKFEIVEPEVEVIQLAGGLMVGGELGFDIPDAITYEHILTGGIRVGGELEHDTFDPASLAPTELVLTGGLVAGGALTVEHVGLEELVYEFDLSGGIVVGEFRIPPIETTAPAESEAEILKLALKGGLIAGGALEFLEEEPEVYEHIPRFGGLRVGGGCIFSFLTPPQLALELAGGVSIGGTLFEEEELMETWAMNGFSFSPSMYSGFPFNSYAEFRNQAYAAGPDGLYLLEGDDDNGVDFHPGVRIGPTNLGTDNLKRLRGVYPGVAGNPELRVEGKQTQKEGFYQLDRRDRFEIGRDVQDRVFTLDIQDFEELSHLEITMMVLMRR